MIRRDDLEYRGLILYQDTALSCFSEDAVLLANYVSASPADRAVDLGAGNGIISILAGAKTGARFTGVEIQEAQCALARRSAAENGQAIEFFHMDVRDAPAALGHGTFTIAVSNPPYYHTGSPSGNPSRAAALHDAGDTLDAFLAAAFLLLQNGGNLYLIYPATQIADLFTSLRAHRLEPKRIRIAAVNSERVPARFLLTAKKNGKPGLVWEPFSA